MTSLDEKQETVEVRNGPIRQRRHLGGAPLLPPAIAYVVLAVAAVVLPSAVAGEAPYGSDAALLDF